MTTEQFIEKARKIHGDRYDYSKVDYKTTRTKVCIICPIHGEFWQTPAQHLAGKKCRACAAEESWCKRKATKEEFIKMAREKHGDRYDYSKVDFRNMTTKVCIICPIHGEFWQTPKSHLKYRCPKCGNELKNARQSSTEEFIEKARKVHGGKYDYSKVKYVNSGQKVCIICPKHGEFWQTPSRHLSGGGCSECFNEKRGNSRRLSHDVFLSQVLNKYGTSYDMSNTKYVNSRTLIETVCKTHGVITDYPLHFLKYGCIQCYKEQKESEKEKEKQQKKLLAIERRNKKIRERYTC